MIAGEKYGGSLMKGIGKGAARDNASVQRAFHGVQNAVEATGRALEDYDDIVTNFGRTSDAAERASQRLAAARRREADAHRTAAGAMREHSESVRQAGSSVNDLRVGIQKLGTAAFLTSRGLGIVVAPAVIAAAEDLGSVILTASQSMYLLPAAATAAAAGIGTLKLATAGFADTIKDIRDPEKFAEGLAGLAPNAQQAALAIQGLLPQFDALKTATQNAFFSGIAEEIDRLATTYLPAVQGMTVDIATSFNEMMTRVADTLMTPENQSTLQDTMTNIGIAFREIVPAAQSFTQAFIDIASVGSGFLPGLADSIADAAANFADFIAEARQSGELAEWIQEGIDALSAIGDMLWFVGETIIDTFGEDGQQNVDNFNTTLNTVKTTVALLQGDFSLLGKSIADDFLGVARQGLKDFIVDIPEMLTTAGNSFIEFANTIKDAFLNGPIKALNTLMEGLNWVAGQLGWEQDMPKIPEIPDIPLMENIGDWAPYTAPPNELPGRRDGRYRTRFGDEQVIPNNTINGRRWQDRDVPAPPATDANGNKLSESELRDQIIMGLDPALWKVDPFAQVPGLPATGAPAAGAVGPNGTINFGAGDPQEVLEANNNVLSQAHDLEESRKMRLALERDNTASQKDIEDAKWKELEDGWALQKAQADLVQKMRGTTRDAANGMDELGVALDPDFGLSKGLAGLAENLTKFLGNVLMAPQMAKWNETVNADPLKGGFGLLGIRGAQNISAGLSPLLGQPLTAEQQAAYYSGSSTGATAMGPAALAGSGGIPYGLPTGTDSGGYGQGGAEFPPWVHQLGAAFGVKPSTYAGHQEDSGLNKGIDWAGPIENMQRFAEYLATVPSSLEQVIWNNPNTGQKIGVADGQFVGPGTSQPGYYAANWAGHQNHVHTRQSQSIPQPGDATGMPLTPGPMTGPGNYGTGQLPVPLPVTIVGGGMPGGAGITPGGAGATAGASPFPAAGGGGLNWDALAAKESGGDWAINTGNGYYGGLQFDQATWDAYKPAGSPDRADLASKSQQIAAAMRGITERGSAESLWPQNYGQLGGPGAFPRGGQGLPLPLQPFNPFGPPNPAPGATGSPMPGSIGPFGVPPNVAATQGGLGASALTPLTSGAGAGGPSGWAPQAPGTGPTKIGGTTPGVAMGGVGGVGVSGGLMDAAMMAAGGLDLLMPGAGMAAQTGMKLANRAVQYAGQLAGIGVSGLMETFLPTGGSELAAGGWLPRIIGGIAGAKPALPNTAGKQGGASTETPPPLTPEQAANFMGNKPDGGGNTVNVEYNSVGQTEDRNGADFAYHAERMQLPPGNPG